MAKAMHTGRTAAVLTALMLTLCGVAPSSALAQSQADGWRWRATIYGWLPDVKGSTSIPAAGGGGNVNADAGDLLRALDFVFMGELEARKGRWGGFTDFIYLDFSDSKAGVRSLALSGPAGIIAIPADVSLNVNMNLKGAVWTLGGTYAVVEKPGYEMLVLGGFRYLRIEPQIDWFATGNIGPLPQIARSGTASAKPEYWDAIIGVRGRADLAGGKWYVPYYLDVGTGDSDRTWQAAVGIGYRFGWGELTAVYRHLDYKFKGGAPVRDLEFSGPMIGASWRW